MTLSTSAADLTRAQPRRPLISPELRARARMAGRIALKTFALCATALVFSVCAPRCAAVVAEVNARDEHERRARVRMWFEDCEHAGHNHFDCTQMWRTLPEATRRSIETWGDR